MAGKKGMKGGMKGSRKYSKRPNPNMMMMQNGDGVWDVIKDVAGKANKFLKDTKLLSTVAGMIPPTTPYVGQIATASAPVLKSLGYGKMMGRGVISSPTGAIISTPDPEKPYSIVRPVGQNQVQTGAGRKVLKF